MIMMPFIARNSRDKARGGSSIVPFLTFFGMILTAPAIVLAAGAGTWTAQAGYAGAPVLGPFATQAQAVQALGTAIVQRCAAVNIPCPLAATTLQQLHLNAETPTTKTYRYTPITPSTPTAWTCYYWTDNPPLNMYQELEYGCAYTSQASAVAAVTSMPGCFISSGGAVSSNYWYTLAGSWSPLLSQQNPGTVQGPIIEGQSEVYDGYEQNPNVNNCATTPTTSLQLWQARGASCPANFSPNVGSNPAPVNGTDTLCYGPLGGTVTGNLMDCANNGGPSTSVGDPCDVATGDFSQTETDYGGPTLKFQRFYHSASLDSWHSLGVGWTHNYAAFLVFGSSGVPQGLLRPDGHDDALALLAPGVYVSLSGSGIHVEQSSNSGPWIAYLKDGTEEVYAITGQLQEIVSPTGLTTTLAYNSFAQLSSVSDAFGHTLQFGYNANGQISTLVEPDGSSITYGYDSNNNLTTAQYPDSSVRTYQYGNTMFPNNLTGILDEQSQQYLTVNYDPTTGEVTSSYQGGSSIQAQAVSLTYSANGAVVTDALSATHTYNFTNSAGYMPRANSLAINGQSQSFTVAPPSTDVQQRVTQYTDANSNISTYAYDSNHLTSKTEALGTAVARTTSYPSYQDTLTSLPTLVVEPLRQTAYAYYPNTYQLHTKTITDTTVTPNVSRTWTYTYTANGQVQTIVGPRTDVSQVTTYTYYNCATGNQCGEIETVQDALGHITTFNSYNGHGQPLSITDPNGVVTTLSYDGRQRLLSSEVGTETTSYEYWPNGLLEQVTFPDSSTVTYSYNAAHQLQTITDGLGNYVSYTLDPMGNRTAEQSYDPSGTLHRSHSRIFNALNELYQDINAAGTAAVTTTLGYDGNHNLTSSDAPLSRNTGELYDALNRVDQITDPNGGISRLGYDANNSLLSVIDPRTLTTSYTNDGFGEVTKLVSPDTGNTTRTFDSGGNLKTLTDARGATGTYTYDALNRVTQIAYSDETIQYTYDTGTNGIGHLTGASDAHHSMSWTYDPLGRVTGKGQTVAGTTESVGYSYTNGDLITLVTPSGQTVTYGYTNHQITSIAINGTTLLSGVTYDPFGPVTGWTWENGTSVSRSYTEDGVPNQIVTAGVTNTYSEDNALRINGITDSGLSSNSWTFGYDLLDRVSTGTSSALTRGYQYDANGNVTIETGSVAFSANITPTNNQIATTAGGLVRTYAYDAAGNTTGYGGNTFTYNQRGRIVTAVTSSGSNTYIYNALGQLIRDMVPSRSTILMYDEAGHILGEYASSTGALIEETIWMGDIPVATLRPNAGSVKVYYVHADHLGTPRKITNPSNNTVVWRWDPDTFGTAAPSIATINYNLRFPGQYYQAESGLFQNNFRDYDPQTGRYLESDPIGLAGGRNPYIYVKDNPISRTDRHGLGGPGMAGTGVDDILQNTPDSKCDYWPALCIAKAIVCTEATCTYTDCHGKPFVIEGVSFLPTPPNREQLAKESPNCKCTKWKAFNDE